LKTTIVVLFLNYIMLRFSKVHQIVPVKELAHKIKVTQCMLQTDLKVLDLLLILCNQSFKKLITELIIIVTVDLLQINQLFL